MMAGRVGWWASLALGVPLLAVAAAADRPAAEVRVLSGPEATSAITVRADPDTAIEDRTPGARAATAPRGPASAGETFTGEIDLFLRDFAVARPAAIEVADPVVSAIRLFPETGGTTVIVFVRQPVTYTVSRPSSIGEIRIEVKSKTRNLAVIGTGPRGQVLVARPKKTAEEREVSVDAESLAYDQQANVLIAKGGVTLTRGDTVLTADEVRYDRTRGVADATGHVVLRDPQATVEGDFAHLDMEDESGWVETAQASLKPSGYTLVGKRIDKLGGPLYSVANGIFTTCQCGGLGRPSWSVSGTRTDVRLSGAGEVRNATFRVKDVPVLYFPYFIFPANNDRQSGFLMPRIANSNRRGFQYEQPFYWAINKSSDATIALDVETRARIGLIGEYRYRLSREAAGEFTAAYYNEQIRVNTKGTTAPNGQPIDVGEDRFAIVGRHRQPFVGGSKFYLNLFAISDDAFLKDINTFAFSNRRDLVLRSTRYTVSSTGVIKTWDRGLLWVDNSYYQDLIDPQEVALQKLPRVNVEHGVPLLNDRLVARVSGEAVDYQRESGFDGLRGDVAPEMFLPFRLGRVLNGSLTGRLRETAYHLTDTEQVGLVVADTGVNKQFRATPELPALDSNRTQESAEVIGRLGTELTRVYDFHHLGFEKLKHTIEPEIAYLYVPNVSRPTFSQQLRPCRTNGAGHLLPGEVAGDNCNATIFSEGFLFDERDAINQRNFISYGVTTRLLARTANAAEAQAHEAEKTAREAEQAERQAAAGAAVDPETLAQGLPAGAVPAFVGPLPPPPEPGPGAKPAPPPAPTELARLSLLHGYDISRQLVGTSHASDVDVGFRVTPVPWTGLLYNATVSLEQSAARGQAVGLFVREPWWAPKSTTRNYQAPTTVTVSYRNVEPNVNQGLSTAEQALFSTGGTQEIDGSLYLRLNDWVGFTFLSRFDPRPAVVPGDTPGSVRSVGSHFLERDYALRVISRCNCWILEAGVKDTFNPDERIFRIQFTLIGLGSYGRRPFSNYVGFAPLSEIGYRRPGAY